MIDKVAISQNIQDRQANHAIHSTLGVVVGQSYLICDPSAVWDKGLRVEVIALVSLPECPSVPPWPKVRDAAGNEFVINPDRLRPARKRVEQVSPDQLPLFA